MLNRPPAITSAPEVEAAVGRAYAYAVAAADPDNDPLAYALTTAPAGMSINPATGALAWTPAAGDVGTHDVTVRVTDGRGGAAELHFVLSVTTPPPNRPPVFTSQPVVGANVGTAYNYQAAAADPDRDPLTFGLLSGPAGLSINPETGLVTWLPTAAQSGGSASSAPSDPTLPTASGFDTSVYADVTDPQELSFDGQGHLFVGRDNGGSGGTSAEPVRIHEVSGNGQAVREYGVRAIDDPDSVLADPLGLFAGTPGAVLVGGALAQGNGLGQISVVRSDEAVETLFGPSGQLGNVSNMTLDHSGRLVFVSDQTNQVLTSRGGLPTVLFTAPGAFESLAIGPDDRIYLGMGDGSIRAYRGDGTLLNPAFASGLGTHPRLVAGPGGVWSNNLYAIDSVTGRLFRLDGQGNRTPLGTGFVRTGDAEFGPDGSLYVSMFDQDRVVRVTPSRQSSGLGPGEQRVLVAASDGRGGTATQEFAVCVEPAAGDHAPVIVSQPVTGVTIPPADRATGGSIFLTGHDPDFHATRTGAGDNPAGAQKINKVAIRYVMDPNFNGFVANGATKFLFVESRITPPPGPYADGLNGIINSGYVLGKDFELSDASTLNDALDHLGTTYGAIVVASDFGGILTQDELDILNARSASIIQFLNAGGGLYAMAESDSHARLTPRGGLFGFLPFVVASVQLDQHETGNSVTNFGASLGLGVTDINGNASHNIFDGDYGLNVIDRDPQGHILSLAGRGTVTGGGVGAAYHYAVAAVDPDRDPLTYSLPQSPAGMTIDPATGGVAWVATAGQVGQSFPVTVRAGGGKGGSDEQTFAINVTAGGGEIRGKVFDDTDGDGLQAGRNLIVNGDFSAGATGFSTDYAANQNLDPEGTYFLFRQGTPYRDGTWPFPDHTTGDGFAMGVNGAVVPNRTVWRETVPVQAHRTYQFSMWYKTTFLGAGHNNAAVQVLVNATAISPVIQTSFTFFGWEEYTQTWHSGDSTSAVISIVDPSTVASGNDFALDDISFALAGSEPGLQSWTAYVDLNRNGHRDPDEQSATTDASGNYSLGGLSPGTYLVSEEGKPGWRQTAPPGRTHEVTITTAGQVIGGQDFANHQTGDSANRSPVVTGAPPAQVTVGQLFRYTPTVTDPDGDPLAFDLPTHPDGMAVDPERGVVVWTPTAGQVGMQTVLLRVQDGKGGTTLQPFQVAVVFADTAPVVTSAPPTGSAVVGLPFRYQARAEDADGDPLAFSLVAPLPGMTLDPATGLFAWTPAAGQVGPHQVVLSVGDGRGGVVTQVLDLAVAAAAADRPPVILNTPRTATWLGRPYAGVVEAADPDGDPLTYQLTPAPAGMQIDAGGVITWAPTAARLGPNPVTVVVSDGRGLTATEQFTVTVTVEGSDRPPVITSAPPVRAVVGRPYAYNPAATEPDGDPVTWVLDAGPHGMTIDPQTGAVRWVPTEDQEGPQAVVVTARDALAASTSQSFTIDVTCVDLPPAINSRPITVAAVGSVYAYPVRATDPAGNPLTYSLLAAPAGMSIGGSSGLVLWTPSAAEVGPQAVVVEVSDGLGNFATQAFAVVVSAAAANRPPVITSSPTLVATVGRPYHYAVAAADPDGGAVTFGLVAPPAGVTIDPATGLVTWVPDGTEVGPQALTVTATDAAGGRAVQSFTVAVNANGPPVITSAPVTTTTAGAGYRYDVRATDPNLDPLAYTLASGPAGMSIDQFGRVVWATTAADVGPHPVSLSVADDGGASVTQSFVVTVAADTRAPRVTLTLSTNPVDLHGSVTFRVAATDDVGVAGRTLTVGGTPVALDPTGRATVRMDNPGLFDVAAGAADAAGNVGTAPAQQLRVVDPADARVPTVVIASPAGGGTVTYLTPVRGTVTVPAGQHLDYYEVDYARADQIDPDQVGAADPHWVRIAKVVGDTPVADGVLATFDPTMLADDAYVVRVVAYNTNGLGYAAGVEVNVLGAAKLGQFALSFTDLSVPLAGVPITITRGYDTRQAGDQGDFGFGWRLGLIDGRIRETVPQTGDGLFATGAPFRVGTHVFVTDPDGNRVGFTFHPVPAGSLVGVYWHPRFVPDPGVYDALSVADVALEQRPDGTFGAFLFGFDYNPDDYTLTTKDGLRYAYNQFSGLQTVTDPHGNTLTFTRDGVVGSSGVGIHFTRDGAGRITAITNPDGVVVLRYRYDANGDLAEVRQITSAAPAEPALTSTFVYRTDRPHYLDSYIDPNGKRAVKTEYDADGRIKSVTDGDGNTATQAYDLPAQTETVLDKRGNPTVITYDDRGNVTKTVQPTESGDIVTRYEYADPQNPDKETKVVNPRGIETTRTYDVRGNLFTETTPDGTTTYTYNALNKVTSVEDALGRLTTYDYTGADLVRVVNALGDSATFRYDGVGRVTKFTDFAGNATTYSDFCQCGRPETVTNPDGTVRHLETNELSQVTDTTDEDGHTTHTTYDLQGRVETVTDGEGKTIRYEYTGSNQTKVTDPLGHETVYGYDAAGNKTSVTDAEGGVTTFTYDANGNLLTVEDPVHNVTTYVYDKANRLKQETDPLGKSRVYEYDAAGNRTQEIDRDGRERTFEYDPMNRVTKENWFAADGSVVRMIASRYDHAGNLLETSDPDSDLTYTYDSLDRVKTATTVYPGTNVPAVTLTSDYDKNGNRKSVADNTGVGVVSVYGDRNQLETRTWQGGGIDPVEVTFDYFKNGDRKTLTRYADATRTAKIGETNYTYYANGLSKTINHLTGTGQLLAGYGYQYDDAGRLVQETHHGDTYVYGYDKTGQLTTVTINGVLSESFSYDKNGNRITVTGPTAGTYVTGLGNRYSTDGTFDYTYDAEGNLKTETEIATGNVTEYTWDDRNRLVKVEERTAGGVLLSASEYAYDQKDRRIVATLNGVTFRTVYDRDNVWADYIANGAVSARYLLGDRIDEMLVQWQPLTGVAWGLTDRLGTVRDVAGAAAIVNKLGYTAFGELLVQTGGLVGERYTYTGRESIASTQLLFYRTRYYSPMTGRFLSVDTIGFDAGDGNLYRYVRNNPLSFTDPSGEILVDDVELTAEELGTYAAAIVQFDIEVGVDYVVIGIGQEAEVAVSTTASAVERDAAIKSIANIIKSFRSRLPPSYQAELYGAFNKTLNRQLGPELAARVLRLML